MGKYKFFLKLSRKRREWKKEGETEKDKGKRKKVENTKKRYK